MSYYTSNIKYDLIPIPTQTVNIYFVVTISLRVRAAAFNRYMFFPTCLFSFVFAKPHYSNV